VGLTGEFGTLTELIRQNDLKVICDAEAS